MKKSSELTANSLSIACVIYDTPEIILRKTLDSLLQALEVAAKDNLVALHEVYLINNNSKKDHEFHRITCDYAKSFQKLIPYSGHGNVGYGKANNLAINITSCTYHLVLNPDVEIAEKALSIGIKYLKENTDVGVLAPEATNSKGEVEYLAKRTPTPFVIFLRGVNHPILNKIYAQKLASYAYKDLIPRSEAMKIELASGCFMLCDTKILKTVNGFDEKYFLYFEDFDICKKISKFANLVYLPQMKIIHLGGNTSKKSIRHKLYFIKAAVKFFLA